MTASLSSPVDCQNCHCLLSATTSCLPSPPPLLHLVHHCHCLSYYAAIAVYPLPVSCVVSFPSSSATAITASCLPLLSPLIHICLPVATVLTSRLSLSPHLIPPPSSLHLLSAHQPVAGIDEGEHLAEKEMQLGTMVRGWF